MPDAAPTSKFTATQWRQKVIAHLEAAEDALANQSQDFAAKGEVARSHAWVANTIMNALEQKVIQ